MATDLESYVQAHQAAHLDELRDFLRIPSISTDPEHVPDLRRCADWLVQALRGMGMTRVEIWETGGHPAVFAQSAPVAGQPTALIYGHYDVQPVDPIELWESPPFEPTIRGDDLYARGAVDDKGQVFMHLKAIEALRAVNGGLPINLTLLIEGEEEIGSSHLDRLVQERAAELHADVVVISDTGMFAVGVPSLCYGLRGLSYLEIKLTGANSDLHSGSYGGAVDNPLMVLAELLSTLKDRHGRITVPGFYDTVRPLTSEERAAWAQLPFDDDEFRRSIDVPALHGEEGYTTLERLWGRPTLEVHGLSGGFQGAGAKTVLPAWASAKLSCRLVPDQNPSEISELVERHLRSACPRTVELEVNHHHGGFPWVADPTDPALQAGRRAIERAFGRAPVLIREGGSIPVVSTFSEVLQVPAVLLGIGLPDEHAHAPNERLHLPNFYGGIRAAAYLWQEMARRQD